jgi:glycosyltransferase involved in cell wall biosynthesis
VLCAIAGLGGGELSLLELVLRLRDSYEFHLIIPGDGPFLGSAQKAGAKTWILPWPKAITRTGETAMRAGPGRLFGAAFGLRSITCDLAALLEEVQPTVFVTNAIKAHIVGALTRRPHHVPLIWYMRDGLENRKLSRKLMTLLSPRCDTAVCISGYVASQFRRYVSRSVAAHVIYNIIDFNRFHPGALPPDDLPKNPKEVWFGVVGAITPLKGQDIFLRAAERVLRDLPNAAFVIAGNNVYCTEVGLDYVDLLRRRANEFLGDRAKFVGFRHDVPRILSRLDVLVQPNRGPEGLGRSLLEAMACGVPVIAVDKWGPAEMVQDGRTGLLFPPLDDERLASHMVTLGLNEPLRKSMGQVAHDWIRDNLASTKLASQFDDVLSGLIASGEFAL